MRHHNELTTAMHACRGRRNTIATCPYSRLRCPRCKGQAWTRVATQKVKAAASVVVDLGLVPAESPCAPITRHFRAVSYGLPTGSSKMPARNAARIPGTLHAANG